MSCGFVKSAPCMPRSSAFGGCFAALEPLDPQPPSARNAAVMTATRAVPGRTRDGRCMTTSLRGRVGRCPPPRRAYRCARAVRFGPMCRNITELRGLEPPATREEIEAAARQFVRKVSGVTKPKGDAAAAMEDAALRIAHITEHLLADLPARRQPPKSDPPLRRPEVRARLGLE